MPNVLGDDDSGLTSSEITGYAGATGTTAGNRTPEEQAAIVAALAKLSVISGGWTDSGGPGGFQQAVAAEVLTRAATTQDALAKSIRQWAKPGRDRALMEMFGVITGRLVEMDKTLLELRERLNDSPY
jgi:hypothetical protein